MFWKGKTLCYHVQTAEEISNLTFLPSNSHASIVTHCLILMILTEKQSFTSKYYAAGTNALISPSS